jgi:hypothetical protein
VYSVKDCYYVWRLPLMFSTCRKFFSLLFSPKKEKDINEGAFRTRA